ncbi:hypothetical protein C7S13_1630 [Burkholderia cepacia]|nr:hypothetical protein [Burkholderia cepacia]MDW9244635.1 hypothetical protein [Burkholderia cepacia]
MRTASPPTKKGDAGHSASPFFAAARIARHGPVHPALSAPFSE